MFSLLRIFRLAISPAARPPGHLPVGWGVDFAPGGSPKVGASELNRGPCDDGRRTPPHGLVRDGDGAAPWGSYLVERGSLSRMRVLHDEQQGRDTAWGWAAPKGFSVRDPTDTVRDCHPSWVMWCFQPALLTSDLLSEVPLSPETRGWCVTDRFLLPTEGACP